MSHKTPSYYVAPLKSRADIVASLINRAKHNSRPGYGLFCYDVKLRNLNTSFTHLLKLGKEAGHVSGSDSARYIAALGERWEQVMEAAFEIATQDACESVTDNDTNRMLWDGDKAIADWGFDGRSGGWLVLLSFDGVTFADALKWTDAEGFLATPEQDGGPSYRWLRDLYRFLVQCDHDFRRPESEVEYLAADYFFANRIDDIPTDAQIAEREAKRAAESEERHHWECRDMVTA